MQSNRVMVIIAVVAGLVAMAAAFGYLRTASGGVTKDATEPAIDIIVAKADLPADHLIDPAVDVAVQKVPSRTFKFLAQAAVKSDERSALRGRRLNTPLPNGQPLLYSHLVGVTDLEITPGSRAFTLDVDDTDMIGGILVPGDRIDLVVSWRLPSAPGRGGDDGPATSASVSQAVGQAIAGAMETRDWGARAALSNVKVLAVGDRLIKSREQFTFGETSGRAARRQTASTLTIEVTTDEALDLIRSLAGGQNKVYVLLRPKQGSTQPSSGGSVLE
jgi:Flp pilus assembly protein CpaB